MEDNKEKLVGFLLADYQSIKSEIARRSNLQKTTHVALVAFYLWMLNNYFSENNKLYLIVVMWAVVLLAYFFYQKEHLEIQRLGSIIRNKIAETASGILSVDPKIILPSETDSANEKYDYKTRAYNTALMVSIFLLIPISVTLYYLLTECGK